jgi:two-component system chemotaxis response regulator CheY
VSPAAPILVVEDDQAILSTIADTLAFEGYRVVTADDGASALEVIKRQPVALILLDMKMPVMDGWAFANAYRHQPVRHAPIVVLTAARDPAQWAAEIEATAYLAKPFDLDALLAVVGRYALNR